MRSILALLLVFLHVPVFAEESPASEPEPIKITTDEVRAAIQKAIPHLENGARVSSKERTCFTCHNQALPVLALTKAKSLGFEVDDAVLEQTVEHTWKHLNRGKDRYQEGHGQGGQIMTAGYAMWTLAVTDHQPDEVTAAVAHYLLEDQDKKKKWVSTSKRRPPSSGSHFTATFLAANALNSFATSEQSEQVESARERAREWIMQNEPEDTEDSAFRLRSLVLLECDEVALHHEIQELLKLQKASGGWTQNSEMKSDAYATATVVSALQRVQSNQEIQKAVNKGQHYLLGAQLDDGTWHVTTRADGFQEYYESGFPHDEDQFISIAATGWAVLALAKMLE